MVSTEPLIEATEVFINPVPVIVEEKIPRGSWPEEPAAVTVGAGGKGDGGRSQAAEAGDGNSSHCRSWHGGRSSVKAGGETVP